MEEGVIIFLDMEKRIKNKFAIMLLCVILLMCCTSCTSNAESAGEEAVLQPITETGEAGLDSEVETAESSQEIGEAQAAEEPQDKQQGNGGTALPQEITDVEDQRFSEWEKVESLYLYCTLDQMDFDSEDSLKTSMLREVSNAQEEKEFLDSYLQKHQIEGEGKELFQTDFSIITYYEKPKENMAHFIISNSWVEGEEYPKDILCFEMDFDAVQKAGYLAYDTDIEGRTLREGLYNAEGSLMTSVSYQYEEEIPFPLIQEVITQETEMNLYTSGETSSDSFLDERTLFALYADTLVYEDDDRVTAYQGDPNSWIWGTSDCTGICEYNGAGKLSRLKENERTVDSDFFEEPGVMDFFYDDNGILSKVEYGYYTWWGLHGTWNSSGTVQYDAMGRPVYREYYVTHGHHKGWYLYHEDQERACAYIQLCSMPYSGSMDEPESWGCEVTLCIWD